MSSNSSVGYMEDRVYGAASLSPLEQEQIDQAIAASLAPGMNSGFEGPDVLPAVATADDKWPTHTLEAVLRVGGPEAGDQIFQNALYAAATRDKDDAAENGSNADSRLSTMEPTQSYQPKPWTITHMVEDMVMRLAVDLPLLNDSDADTLVFIDPASQQLSQDSYAYRMYTTRYRLPHRMRREKFLALHSPYFDKAFGPTNQHRVLRRRGLVNKLPEGIKYVLDLTPPGEGEDAVYLMTELCCSIGVRRWFQAGKRWNVAQRLVGGQDEPQMEPYTVPKTTQAQQGVEQPNASVMRGGDDQTSTNIWGSEPRSLPFPGSAAQPNKQGPSFASTTDSLPLEYTAMRHRAAIERVLHAAVEGLDPRIDSAPKLWTTFAVAKYFEITHSPLTDYIVSWLRAPPNSYFLEVLPETSQKIADGLQCWDLCRDTFAILVGEEALGNVSRTSDQPKGDSAHSVYGRCREDLQEDYQTRIEYASKSFIERMISRFSGLVNESMTWLDEIPAYAALSELETTADYKGAIKELKDILKAYVRGRIYWVSCRDYKGLIGPVPDTKRIGSDLFPTTSFTETYSELLLQERIFTRSFWKALEREDFSRGLLNTHTNTSDLWSPSAGWSSLARSTYDAKLFEEVAKWRVEDRIKKLNDIHAELYPSKEPEINQAPSPRGKAWSPDSDDPAKPFWDLSIRSPKKNKIDRIDETDGWAHDGKRRRVSSTRGNWLLTTTKGSQSSSRLPIRLALQTPFPKQNIGAPLPLGQDLTEAADSGCGKDGSDATDEAVIHSSPLGGEAPAFTPQSPPENVLSKPATSQAPIIPNNDTKLPLPLSSLDNWQVEVLTWAQGSPSQSPLSFQFPPSAPSRPTPKFDLTTFLHSINNKLKDICMTILASPDASTRTDTLELVLTDTLVSLAQSEWKFLPLWAGGNDDGSGGVFDDSVPLAETAVSAVEPGPGFHTGLSSAASSEFEMVGGGGGGKDGRGSSSTLHTSTVVNASSRSEQMDRRRVYEADEAWSEVLAGRWGGGESGSSVVGGAEKGMGRGKGKEKEEVAESESEWSEVTTGKEGGDFLLSSTASMDDDVDEEEVEAANNANGARQGGGSNPDELLDDIWNSDNGDETASGNSWDGDSGDDDEEDMVLL